MHEAGGKGDSVANSKPAPAADKYWVENYRTTFTTEELLETQKEIHEREAKTSLQSRYFCDFSCLLANIEQSRMASTLTSITCCS